MDNEAQIGAKLLLSYDIIEDQHQAYFQFMVGRYVPIVQAMGVRMNVAWHTAYGDYPERLLEFVASDRDTMMALLENETWHALNEKLLEYVTDFSYKVIRYREEFQFF